MEQFDTYELGGEDMCEMVAVDAVAGDEAFENMQALWGENVDAASLKRFEEGSATFSMRRASMKCWHIAFAISRVIEKVVVVVVVTMREGSRGSGPRLDCENLRAARFCAASSLGPRISQNLQTG